MALAVTDFITPLGEFTPAMFPNDDLDALVTAWIAAAELKSEDERAQREWVMHLGFTVAANGMHAGLASDTKGPVSASRSDAQFHYFARKALSHKYAFLALTGVRGVW
jgi:hypothetical protein